MHENHTFLYKNLEYQNREADFKKDAQQRLVFFLFEKKFDRSLLRVS